MISVRVKNYCFVTWHSCRLLLLDFSYILESRAQKDELRRLIRWANRKKLNRVGDYYRRLLEETEVRLSSQALRHPHLVELTEWVYCAATMLNPSPKVYTKGSASKYGLRN